ncbi:MAG: type II toxin-antitoxin system RelE/ParE family toxin [Opitutaceae bacterium]|jgi:plasmid stabilization system protein ParE
MTRVIVTLRAQEDILTACQWYESERTGLGLEYVAIIDAVLALVARNPAAFRQRHDEMRMAITPRFPYLICFVWNEAGDVVSVRRVLHAKRDRPPLSGGTA